MSWQYIAMQHVLSPTHDRELKKGSAELLILSLVERQARHGYDICKLIETRSKGELRFNVASLYPLLYRLEKRGWIHGRWVEKAGQRRRRYYRLTPEGRKVLPVHRRSWLAFVEAIRQITGVEHA
jgi:PadR family transcriptional regulator PadR